MAMIVISVLYAVLLIVISIIGSNAYQYVNPDFCKYTPTTVSGTQAPKGQLCKGQLLLNEQFYWFNRDLWKHELTLGGGGVSSSGILADSNIFFFFLEIIQFFVFVFL